MKKTLIPKNKKLSLIKGKKSQYIPTFDNRPPSAQSALKLALLLKVCVVLFACRASTVLPAATEPLKVLSPNTRTDPLLMVMDDADPGLSVAAFRLTRFVAPEVLRMIAACVVAEAKPISPAVRLK